VVLESLVKPGLVDIRTTASGPVFAGLGSIGLRPLLTFALDDLDLFSSSWNYL